MRMKCVLCGKQTEPYAYIGAMAVGPKCARKAGITPGKTKKGAAIRFTKLAKRDRGPVTIDMFEQLEDHDLQRNTPEA